MNRMLGLLVLICVMPAWGQDEVESPLIEPEALELLRAGTNGLAKSNTFTLRSEIGYDSVQDDGEKIEFGVSRTTIVQRPDKVRIESLTREGRHTELVLDGQRLWYYTPAENTYASASQPGDISVSLAFVAGELGVPQALSQLLEPDPYQELAEGLTSAVVVGNSTIDGVLCTHAAYRNDGGDFQLWVSQTDPQIRRIVISYRNAPGQPQFWANLVELDVKPKITADTFRFSPPDNAERLKFIIDGKPDTPAQGD